MIALGLFAVLAAAAAFSSPEVSFRSAERDGARVAEVLIGERPVIVIRTSAAGYSPLERAEIIANRLRAALATEVGPDDVTVSSIPSGAALNMKDQLIVAIYQPEADAHAASSTALARLWRENILLALGQDVPDPQSEQPGTAQDQAPEQAAPATGETAAEASSQVPAADVVDWTGSAQKWVPIVSVEQGGLSIGAAQVAGPPSQVHQVKGVAELRLTFRNIGRVYAYVPVRTLSVTRLDRVQGVSVWATGSLELVNF